MFVSRSLCRNLPHMLLVLEAFHELRQPFSRVVITRIRKIEQRNELPFIASAANHILHLPQVRPATTQGHQNQPTVEVTCRLLARGNKITSRSQCTECELGSMIHSLSQNKIQGGKVRVGGAGSKERRGGSASYRQS